MPSSRSSSNSDKRNANKKKDGHRLGSMEAQLKALTQMMAQMAGNTNDLKEETSGGAMGDIAIGRGVERAAVSAPKEQLRFSKTPNPTRWTSDCVCPARLARQGISLTFKRNIDREGSPTGEFTHHRTLNVTVPALSGKLAKFPFGKRTQSFMHGTITSNSFFRR